jgi:hypothetical protein
MCAIQLTTLCYVFFFKFLILDYTLVQCNLKLATLYACHHCIVVTCDYEPHLVHFDPFLIFYFSWDCFHVQKKSRNKKKKKMKEK